MSDWSTGIEAAVKALEELDTEGVEIRIGHPALSGFGFGEAAETSIRGFLSVQPSIRWCEEHFSVSMKEPGDEDGFDCQIAHLLNALQPCRIVERKLVDAPHIG